MCFLKIRMVYISKLYKVYLIKNQEVYFIMVIKGLMNEYNLQIKSQGKKCHKTLEEYLQFELLQEHDLLINTHGGMIGGKVVEHNLYRKKLETKNI